MRNIIPLFALILSSLLLVANNSFAQLNYNNAYQTVLKRSHIGKEYSFDRSKDVLFENRRIHKYDSLVLVYLGKITTSDGRTLKFLTSRWYWSTSPRATSRIIVFNSKNQYLGDYYLTMTYDVPDRIEGSTLVFVNENESNCTPKLVTRVSFRRGIPKHFFLKCEGKLGDIYNFAQNL